MMKHYARRLIALLTMGCLDNVVLDQRCIRIGPDLQGYWLRAGGFYALLVLFGLYFSIEQRGGWLALLFILLAVLYAVVLHTGSRVEIDGEQGTVVVTHAFVLRQYYHLRELHPEPLLVDEHGSVGWYLGARGNPHQGKQIYLHASSTSTASPEARFMFFYQHLIPQLRGWLGQAHAA